MDVELVVEVRGSHTDAVTGRDPYHCHPAEHDEEREILSITVGGDDLPEDLVDKLRPYFDPLVYDLDLKQPSREEDD